ncbi:MAG: MFS transporter [Candidatus Bathyarchaeota archaeon]|jgi:predicted MFS family arabinose efflux permease|nr:MFS transporter [Candidatus Bathyarchaeota archaeon]
MISELEDSKKNIHIALLGAAHSLNHSLFVIAPPLLSLIMNELGTSKSVIGAVATIASMLYGVGALVGGPLGDRIGENKTITLCLMFSGLSTFVMFAASAMHSIYVYAVALTLMAAWASLYHPTANSLISKAFKVRVAETMGLHGVGGTLGVVLTPYIAWFLGVNFGWSWAFIAFGILCVLLALIFLKNFNKAERREEKSGTIIEALKIRELWALLIFNIAIGFFMKGVELFFPTYLEENRGIDSMWASIAYTMLLAAGVPGQWIGGRTADKMGSKKVLIATSFGVCVSLLSLLFLPAYNVGIAIFIIFYGVSFYAHQPALNSLTGLLSPQNQRGAVYGVFFFTSFGIGSFSQFVAGYVADMYGFDAAFYVLTVFAIIALILSFKIPKISSELKRSL